MKTCGEQVNQPTFFSLSVNPDLDEATGQNDAGVAMLNAYNYVHDQSSSTDGLAFITSCYNKVCDIKDFFSSIFLLKRDNLKR